MQFRVLVGVALALFIAAPAAATDGGLVIDAGAARATLDALDNPALTLDQAKMVAALPGNQGLVRKAISYGRKVDQANLAAALVAAAHGDAAAPDPGQFQFPKVHAHAAELRKVLATLEDPATGLIDAAKRRIALFTPPGATVAITGYLVVGGSSGGFSFDEPNFYLNLDYFPDAMLATTILQHELYHAVQNAARPAETLREATKQCLTRIAMPEHMDDLFDSLFVEGTASSVGDVLALPADATGSIGDERKKVRRNVGMVGSSVTLMELSAHAVAAKAVDFDSIYALGFYGDEILYALGYVMAKAIEKEEGQASIAALTAKGSGGLFIDRYRQLKAYGKSADAPALGPTTIDWAKRIAAC